MDGKRFRHIAPEQKAQIHFSCPVIRRAYLDAVDATAFRQEMQCDAAVESAECVKIIIGQEQLYFFGIEPVVQCGAEGMLSCRKFPRFKFDAGIGQVREPDFPAVNPETCTETEPAEFQQGVRRILLQRETRPLKRDSPFAVIRGGAVERSGNAHDVMEREFCGIKLFQFRVADEIEVPCSVENKDFSGWVKWIGIHTVVTSRFSLRLH